MSFYEIPENELEYERLLRVTCEKHRRLGALSERDQIAEWLKDLPDWFNCHDAGMAVAAGEHLQPPPTPEPEPEPDTPKCGRVIGILTQGIDGSHESECIRLVCNRAAGHEGHCG